VHPDYINVPTLIVDCVSVAIAYIPEGLPIAVTASLTITANLLKKNKVLCKSLKTVETLGAVSVICTDKTGTLTRVCQVGFKRAVKYNADQILQNRMSVTDYAVHTASSILDATGANSQSTMNRSALQQLRSIAGLCNAAEFDSKSENVPLSERAVFGDATDQAILRFSEGLGSTSELKQGWKSFFTLAFDSKNKFMIKTFTTTMVESANLSVSPTEASNFQPQDMYVQITYQFAIGGN
jgi:magnesium-transporting ATPase (P-type)